MKKMEFYSPGSMLGALRTLPDGKVMDVSCFQFEEKTADFYGVERLSFLMGVLPMLCCTRLTVTLREVCNG